MSYRVYDNEESKWIKDNIYMNPDSKLYKIKQSLFGMVKIPLALDSERYIYQVDIGIVDCNGKKIYDGDYIRANIGKVDEEDENSEDKIEIGLVSYAPELAMYIILCVNSDTWYSLGSEYSDRLEVIGNVFDGYEGGV